MYIRLIGATFTALLLCAMAHGQSSPIPGELETRTAILAEFNDAFGKADYASIEKRYAQWMVTGQRTGSGLFIDNVLVRSFFPRDESGSRLLPMGAPLPAPGNDAYWAPLQAAAEAWANASPNSVLPVLALARIHTGRAFDYRGGGYASTVTEEGWKNFDAYVNKAQAALLSREAAGKKDPNWWGEVLDVAKLNSKSISSDQYAKLAKAALDAFPRRQDIYFKIAYRFTPQWGGSLKQVAEFADEAVQRTEKTDGKAMYARIYWALYGILPKGILKTPQADWPKIRAGFDDLVKQYPAGWNLNFYARMACDAGDKKTAKRVLARIENDVEPSLWPSRSAYNFCKQWAGS